MNSENTLLSLVYMRT